VSVFVDTGVFYAQHDESSNRHDTAQQALEATATGRFGQPLTSDYIVDETVTLTLSRFNDPETALPVGQRIVGTEDCPSPVELLFVGPDRFHQAIDLVAQYSDQRLSFTDATTVTLVDEHDIDYVLSFDSDFDGIVDRLDPAEL